VPETVALFQACYLPPKTHVIALGQESTHALAVPGFAVAPASPLRHYPLVAPRVHRMPLIRSRPRVFHETASISGNTFAVAVPVDRSVAEATRIRQSEDHRSPQTGPMEIRGDIKRRYREPSSQQVFASPGSFWVDCDGLMGVSILSTEFSDCQCTRVIIRKELGP
jgi:hypothetical protein